MLLHRQCLSSMLHRRRPGRCCGCDGPFVTSLRFVISVLDSEDTEQADLRGGRSPWYATAEQALRLEVVRRVQWNRGLHHEQEALREH